MNLLTKGEYFPTISISLMLPLQCKAILQPALNVLIVLSLSVPFKLFIDKSSDINKFLNRILRIVKDTKKPKVEISLDDFDNRNENIKHVIYSFVASFKKRKNKKNKRLL